MESDRANAYELILRKLQNDTVLFNDDPSLLKKHTLVVDAKEMPPILPKKFNL